MRKPYSTSLTLLGLILLAMIAIHLITLFFGKPWISALDCFFASLGYVVLCGLARRSWRISDK